MTDLMLADGWVCLRKAAQARPGRCGEAPPTRSVKQNGPSQIFGLRRLLAQNLVGDGRGVYGNDFEGHL